MPIMLLSTDHGHEPVVVCDFCGERIDSAQGGNYEWWENPEGVGSLCPPMFLHKTCSRPNQQRLRSRPGRQLLHMELQAFLPRLAHNLQVSLGDLRYAADFYGVGEPKNPNAETAPAPLLRLVKPESEE